MLKKICITLKKVHITNFLLSWYYKPLKTARIKKFLQLNNILMY